MNSKKSAPRDEKPKGVRRSEVQMGKPKAWGEALREANQSLPVHHSSPSEESTIASDDWPFEMIKRLV